MIIPLTFKRYVDDIFAVFRNKEESESFLHYLNSKHVNIKFTIEHEKHKKLPFLDIYLVNSDEKDILITKIYRKVTIFGVLTNYLSFTDMNYKIGLVKCLIDRIYKINNTWEHFYVDLTNMFEIFQKNSYPQNILDRITRNYINNKIKPMEHSQDETKIRCTLNYLIWVKHR